VNLHNTQYAYEVIHMREKDTCGTYLTHMCEQDTCITQAHSDTNKNTHEKGSRLQTTHCVHCCTCGQANPLAQHLASFCLNAHSCNHSCARWPPLPFPAPNLGKGSPYQIPNFGAGSHSIYQFLSKLLFFQNATQVQLRGGKNPIVLYQEMKLQFESGVRHLLSPVIGRDTRRISTRFFFCVKNVSRCVTKVPLSQCKNAPKTPGFT